MKQLFSGIAFAVIASASGVVAAQTSDHASQVSSTQAAAGVASLTEGEVRKVDKDAKKLTIRHTPIQNLEMPAMTMVFQVADGAMLERVKAGDKILFAAGKTGGVFTVTQIEQAK